MISAMAAVGPQVALCVILNGSSGISPFFMVHTPTSQNLEKRLTRFPPGNLHPKGKNEHHETQSKKQDQEGEEEETTGDDEAIFGEEEEENHLLVTVLFSFPFLPRSPSPSSFSLLPMFRRGVCVCVCVGSGSRDCLSKRADSLQLSPKGVCERNWLPMPRLPVLRLPVLRHQAVHFGGSRDLS